MLDKDYCYNIKKTAENNCGFSFCVAEIIKGTGCRKSERGRKFPPVFSNKNKSPQGFPFLPCSVYFPIRQIKKALADFRHARTHLIQQMPYLAYLPIRFKYNCTHLLYFPYKLRYCTHYCYIVKINCFGGILIIYGYKRYFFLITYNKLSCN